MGKGKDLTFIKVTNYFSNVQFSTKIKCLTFIRHVKKQEIMKDVLGTKKKKSIRIFPRKPQY